MELHDKLQQLKVEFEKRLPQFLYGSPHQVAEAMKYSLQIGGKRIRPILLLLILEAFNVDKEKGMATACALEMIHTYSLIHDDLPAMDNDDYRRGKLTNHKVYGEAIAILAGDGLLTDAFNVIARDEQLSHELRLKLISLLSIAAGTRGMIEGQLKDIEGENQSVTLAQLKEIHQLKTGKLLEFAAMAAGLIIDEKQQLTHRLRWFASHLGLAFQIQDDILDVTGNMAELGKTPGSDVAMGKATYVSLLGLDGAKAMLDAEIAKALSELQQLDADTTYLQALTKYIGTRTK